MKIILSGGGTLGPVSPLLAVAEIYREHDPSVNFLWVGTSDGPEEKLVRERGIPFIAIGSGKWRRYLSLLNIVDLFKLAVAFVQSIVILSKEKPDLLISAGGYVSVPLHAAAVFFAIPCWVHQQDVDVGLANRLMYPTARKITTALSGTAAKLPAKKTDWIGNPSRNLTAGDREVARKRFNIPAGAPVIFAFGGGTGSNHINKLIIETLPQIDATWQILHIVGRERLKEPAQKAAELFPNYHPYEFFTDEMKDAYALADVVVARAGFGTLTELASLSKAAIILPMVGTHQEDNARYFAEEGGIVSIDQVVSSLRLAQLLKELIESASRRRELGERLHVLLPVARAEKIIEIIVSLTKKRPH
ncbi:MAG: UDP-N-acetylglucosamine--N-acetylmuramyl-(pentapeptide) pyrophosphoryl-undecaprenol N-acetylglucosamine transferase [Patescibacteria group bacterium]